MTDFLDIFSGREVHIAPAQQLLFRTDDPVQDIHLICSGYVVLERYSEAGAVTCYQRARDNDVLAEASMYSERYHCDARAIEVTRYQREPIAEFKQAIVRNPDFAEAWTAYLSRTIQRTRLACEIRSMRTVAERLDAWLSVEGSMPVKGNWRSIADEIAVSPEALYRELARRKQSKCAP